MLQPGLGDHRVGDAEARGSLVQPTGLRHRIGRVGLGFRILSIRRLGADGPPLRGGEPLLGFRLRSRGVSFVVRSSGCTEKADFVVDVEESGGVHELRLRRIVPDPCQAVVPSGMRIRYSYRELELRPGDEVRVVNPSASIEVDPRRR